MHLIVGHEHADFDALASQIAASRLYAGARIVLSGSVCREVHPYLALHRDRFAFVDPSDVDWASVETVVLVDVRCASRIRHVLPALERGRVNSAIELHIFDHHAAREDDLRGELEVIEPIGSTTTLLVERLADAGVELDPVEATLCALGIHTDTGSLTFPNSSERDARALGWLMRAGAELTVVNRYLHAPFSARQREVITRVLGATVAHELGGLRIGIAIVPTKRKLNGLDEVTSRALDTMGQHALFAIYAYGSGRAALIARARTPLLDVGQVLAQFGGGGHAGAASAMLHDEAPESVAQRLLLILATLPLRVRCVRDVMSSPVHQVAPQTPLSVVAERLALWRHTGLCVVEQGKLRGVISQRDVERARRAGRLNLPASSHLGARPITCQPETPLEQALTTMEKEDIGRLPVLEGERLVGIITRSDLLASLYAIGVGSGHADADG